MIFFFKQKTSYEMLISDWSSDVCSSDLPVPTSPSHDTGCPGFGLRSHPQNLIRIMPAEGVVDGVAGGVVRRGRLRERGDRNARFTDDHTRQIGRASCRERVCQYV